MIDRSQYVNAPIGTIDETSTLGVAIIENAKGKKHKANVVEALEYVGDRVGAVNALQVAQAKQINTPTTVGVDPTVIDMIADRSWRAFKLRLEAAAMLPTSNPDSVDAAYALQRIFGDDGLEFLGLAYPAQFNQMKVHLVPLFGDQDGKGKEAGLLDKVTRIVGKAYVDHVVAQLEPYEKMVVARAASQTAVTVTVAPVHRELQEAIVEFAMAVIGNVKRGDAASLADAKAMLLPIDNARAKAREGAAKRGSKTKVVEVPAAPVAGAVVSPSGVDVAVEIAEKPAAVVERKPS